MKRTILTTGVAAVTLMLFTSCGGDSAVQLPGAVATTPMPGGLGTNPDGGDMGGGDSGEMSQECLDFAMAYASALGAMGGAAQGAEGDWQAWVASMQASVPDELKDAVGVWGNAMNGYLTVLEQYADNPMAPEVVTALEALNTPEVQAASERISAYFENNCQL